jgi:cathepsin A (carboxypeptidase C)
MKLLASTLLLGAASATIAPQQQILNNPFKDENHVKTAVKLPVSDVWSKSLHSLSESMKGMTSEAKAIWDDVAMHFPEVMDKATFFSAPKPNTRKPDSAWDYVVKGADIQSVWIENSQGEKEREIDGKLSAYNLRAKKVDPSKLGVDSVKQYSGYLDDEENDKHLFYCESSKPQFDFPLPTDIQGSSNHETIPRTTR